MERGCFGRHGESRSADDRSFSVKLCCLWRAKQIPVIETVRVEPVNPYGFSKFVCERMMEDFRRAYGVKSVLLRYFNAAGADPTGDIGEDHEPETHIIPLVLEALGKKPSTDENSGIDYQTSDERRLDYVHVADLLVLTY